MINDKQIEEALKNIADLKTAVNNNLADIKPSLMNKRFLNAILINDIIFSIATIITIIATFKFGSILNAPLVYQVSTVAFIIIAFIYIYTQKMSALRTSKENSFRNLLKHRAFNKLYVNMLITFFTAFILYMGICFQFDGIVNVTWTLLPLLVIAYGICVILSGNALYIKELALSGYGIIILAIVTFFLYRSSVLLWTMIDITIILYILYFALKASIKRSK